MKACRNEISRKNIINKNLDVRILFKICSFVATLTEKLITFYFNAVAFNISLILMYFSCSEGTGLQEAILSAKCR